MPSPRVLATLVTAAAVGLGVGACSDRQNQSQGNDGGDAVGITSPSPTATAESSGTATEAVPSQATDQVGTITAPTTSTDVNPGGAEVPGGTTTEP